MQTRLNPPAYLHNFDLAGERWSDWFNSVTDRSISGVVTRECYLQAFPTLSTTDPKVMVRESVQQLVAKEFERLLQVTLCAALEGEAASELKVCARGRLL